MASGGLGIRFKPNMDGNLHVVDLVSVSFVSSPKIRSVSLNAALLFSN